MCLLPVVRHVLSIQTACLPTCSTQVDWGSASARSGTPLKISASNFKGRCLPLGSRGCLLSGIHTMQVDRHPHTGPCGRSSNTSPRFRPCPRGLANLGCVWSRSLQLHQSTLSGTLSERQRFPRLWDKLSPNVTAPELNLTVSTLFTCERSLYCSPCVCAASATCGFETLC